MTDRIYLSVPHMGEDEELLVAEAFRSNWLSSVGPHIDGFEREIAERLDSDVYALAVTSGTAALHLVLRHAGVGPGDRVAVSTLTFAASVFPVLYLGATPVFVDSETTSGNIDASLVDQYFQDSARRGELPKALIAVHLYGQHADVDALLASCERHGVVLVEDSAESLGATYRGRQTGTTAPYAILSFNGNKIITTTGGGMVISRNPDAIARMRKWATQSRETALEYLHAELGYNYRMSNVLAAIGRGQLRMLDERVASRRRIAQRYASAFADLPGVSLQPEAPWGMHTRWLTVVHLDPAVTEVRPLDVIEELGKHHIESRPVWRPMHTQPLFEGASVVAGETAEQLYRTGLCLPSSSSLAARDQSRVIEAVRSVFSRVPSIARSMRAVVSR